MNLHDSSNLKSGIAKLSLVLDDRAQRFNTVYTKADYLTQSGARSMKSQKYCVSGLCPSSGILNTRKQIVSETDPVFLSIIHHRQNPSVSTSSIKFVMHFNMINFYYYMPIGA
jgi:hypothetical protein